ncbi:MAG TPA: ABC transporter permease [Acidimicrobiales bacterium]|nr:ABC transporter permease [Acidimicrobiales bacterium]
MTDTTTGDPPAGAVPGHPGTDRVHAGARWAFVGLLSRDIAVLWRNKGEFLGRTVIQPLLFVFVFTYVFPKIGQTIPGAAGTSFATVLVPGLVAVAAVFSGITAVGLPLSVEFGATREIEDRAMAPCPVSVVALEKVAYGALHGLASALVVFPLVLVVPVTPVTVHVANWALLVVVLVLACGIAGALGLTLGTVVKPEKIGLMFAIVVLPLTFLGCVYYPWQQLAAVRWLQVLVLLNPVVYVCEGMRNALTPFVPHMATWASLGAMVLFFALLLGIGMARFYARIVT